MLAHNPELFDGLLGISCDLVLSGHTHGGQARLPFGGAIRTPEAWFPEYSDGLYEKKDTKLIISMGLGESIIPLRLFAPPEITVVTLFAA